jgi:hypothetical protein
VQLDLYGLPYYPFHASGFGGQNLDVLDLDAMSPADAVFSYGRFVSMSQMNVPVVLLDPGRSTPRLHDATSQKALIFILVTVRTQNLTCPLLKKN